MGTVCEKCYGSYGAGCTECPHCGEPNPFAPLTLAAIEQSERDAHAAVSASIRNADGIPADKFAHRAEGVRIGIGNDSKRINDKLTGE